MKYKTRIPFRTKPRWSRGEIKMENHQFARTAKPRESSSRLLRTETERRSGRGGAMV